MALEIRVRVFSIHPVLKTVVLLIVLLLAGSIIQHGSHRLYPHQTELFAERMMQVYEGAHRAPEWQRVLFAPTIERDTRREVLGAYRDTEADDQTWFQLALIQMRFGQTAAAFETLKNIETPGYDPLIQLLKGMELNGEELQRATIAVAGSETWWSYYLRRTIPQLELPVNGGAAHKQSVMWKRTMILQTMWYSILATALVLLVQPRRHRETHPPNKYLLAHTSVRIRDFTWAFLAMVVLYVLSGVGGYFAWEMAFGTPGIMGETMLETFCRLMPPVVLAAWICRSWKFHLRAWGLVRPNRASVLWWTSTGVILMMCADYVVQLISIATNYSGLGDVLDPSLLADGSAVLMSQLWIAGFLAPVSEEIIFRGLLYPVLRGRLGVWPAILVQAAVFASIHIYSWIGALSVFGTGILLCWLFEKSKSLWPSILLHSIYNIFTTLVVWMYFGKAL